MYESLVTRARLFSPIAEAVSRFIHESSKEEEKQHALHGYIDALAELEQEGVLSSKDGYVAISESLIVAAKSPKTRFVNLTKQVPRALFTSLFRIFPQILSEFAWNKEYWSKFPKNLGRHRNLSSIVVPMEYVFVPTASGLVSLGNRADVETCARRVLKIPKNAATQMSRIGGMLNDVFLVKALIDGDEKRIVVKKFRDWSSAKWFPIAIWGLGTKTFAVLGVSRLERECAYNQLLGSHGFHVPRLLYVSPGARLVFMEYVGGEPFDRMIKRLAHSKDPAREKKEMKSIERIGRTMAKIHAAGIALGDTKPENFLIGEHGEVYLMDFEQSSRSGDMTWDVAEFLYYAGHYVTPLTESNVANLLAGAFIKGYLEAGGKAEVVRKAANPKYTKVFSIFTLPLVILSISNECRSVAVPEESA